MARLEGFIQTGYRTLSGAESCDETHNFYYESVEVPNQTKSPGALYTRLGCKPFGVMLAQIQANPTLAQSARAMIQYDGNGVLNGAVFGVSGNQFWQMDSGGGVTIWGAVVDDGKPAQIIANSATVGQIAIISGNELYILSGGVFTHIINDGTLFFGARRGAMIDGYLVVLSNTPNNQQFQISAINQWLQIFDPVSMTWSWNALNTALLEGQADPIQNLIVNVEYIYFIGSRRGEIWYNSGAAAFPFTIQTGAFLEYGTNALNSLCQSNSTAFWMGQDARGEFIALMASGLTTRRISNHAVEAAWAGYSTTDDCLCYPLTINGHSLIRYIFPTADKGWEYDVTQSAASGYPVWNEISFTDGNGVEHAPFERTYCYAFNRGLIGSGGADGSPGLVYEIDQGTFYDCQDRNIIPFPATADNVAPLPAANTSMGVFAVSGGFISPGTLIVGNYPIQEIMTYDLFTDTGGATGTFTGITRGQFGTVAQDWPATTLFTQVTVSGFPITRRRVFRLPFNGGLRVFLDRLEFFIQTGVGQSDPGAPGYDPQMVLQIARETSSDGSPIWGDEIFIPMGKQGEYLTRLLANRLGYYRDGAIRVTFTDPVMTALIGCEIYARNGVG